MSAPPGTRLAMHPVRGRSLVATRSFKPGELIGTFDKPLLALPDGPSMRTTCNHCLRTRPPFSDNSVQQTFRACTGCRAVVYCDADCQRAHWKSIHKAECKMFARVHATVGKDWLPTPTRAVAQVLLSMMAGHPAMLAAFGDGGLLEGNVDGFKGEPTVWADFELQAMAAVVYGGLLESEEMLARAREVLCKIQTNAFNRLDADTGMAGIFLDTGLSMINHSCVPNAFIGFDRRTAMLRAERPIAEGDEIEISYIDTSPPKPVRQEGLKLYHFQCACPRCEDDLDVYRVCAASPVIPLNEFSLQPDLARLRDPPVERTKVSNATIEAAYKVLSSPEFSEAGEQVTRQRWKVCQSLIRGSMWAVEPVPATILQAVLLCQADPKTLAYALPLSCFLATDCDPFKLVAPFMPWRIKGVMLVAKLLSETARLTANGELARDCPHKDLVAILTRCDQLSMCEATLRLVVHDASIGAAEGWEVLQEAKVMLAELESLDGRERESGMLRAWAKDPQDPAAALFFQEVVLKPINELAALAPSLMEIICAVDTLA